MCALALECVLALALAAHAPHFLPARWCLFAACCLLHAFCCKLPVLLLQDACASAILSACRAVLDTLCALHSELAGTAAIWCVRVMFGACVCWCLTVLHTCLVHGGARVRTHAHVGGREGKNRAERHLEIMSEWVRVLRRQLEHVPQDFFRKWSGGSRALQGCRQLRT